MRKQGMESKPVLHEVVQPNAELGIQIVMKGDIPSAHRKNALVPQLSAAKAFIGALDAIKSQGIGVSEEAFSIDLSVPATKKEAEKLGLKKVFGSFFAWAAKQLKQYKLENQVELTRRDGGRIVYLVGPQPNE
jgi:hypothetical protein